jgi:hypothetical protein
MMRVFRCGVVLVLLTACSAAPVTGPGDGGPRPPDSGPGDGGTNPNDDVCGNGLDDDRDGRVDEDCSCTPPGSSQRCYGGDPALAGIGGCIWGTQRCVSNFEFSEWDTCEGWGEPEAETCDGVDNDCDGTTDEGCDCVPGTEVACYDGPGITEGVGACIRGRVRCIETATGSEYTACEGAVLPSEEVCDGVGDEDCDELVDEGCACLLGETQSCYGGAPGTAGVGTCRAGTQACVRGGDGEPGWTACTDEVRPRVEACTGGLDEDCDGLSDCSDPDCALECCTPYNEVLRVVPAQGDILFVVDRSGSMLWPAVGTTRTRWQELTSAMTGVLPMLDRLPMGMLTFPMLTGDGEVRNCMVASSPDVPIALGSRSTILSRLTTAAPRAGDTPTPAAFMTSQSYLASVTSSSRRFVILATDGLPEPNCGATVDATVAAITELRRTLGVDVFVIGIVGPDRSGDTSGIPALQAGLNRMADAGGRPRSGAIRYYEAVDAAALTTALTSILAAATDCRFELSRVPERPAHLEVRQNTTLVPRSSWSLSGRTLTISGTYCTQIQNGLVSSITVSDSCTSL